MNIHDVNADAMKQAVERNEVNGHDVVSDVSRLLVQHYNTDPDGPLNYLLVRESILSIHGQTRPRYEHPAFYAIELLKKAQQDSLHLTIDVGCLFCALQFELPRKK